MSAADHGWIRCGDRFVTLEIVVRPNASRRGVERSDARGLVIALNSPPEKGKANDELIEVLARALKIPRSAVTIVRGMSSRRKTVRVTCGDVRTAAAMLEAMAGTRGKT